MLEPDLWFAAMPDTPNIDHLTHLARLSLDAQARQAARQKLTDIIAMIDPMQSVDTEGVEPMAHPMDATQRLRNDQVTEEIDRSRLQAGAPEVASGYYLVPRVVE